MQLIDHAQVEKFYFQGSFQQTLAGADQGLKAFEVWLLHLAPGREVPAFRYQCEVAAVTLAGAGRVVVEGEALAVRPDTTLVIPAGAMRSIANPGPEELVLLLIRGREQS
jgi:mannose-6-phosphate isomerase-like protein (cupin superfamily)